MAATTGPSVDVSSTANVAAPTGRVPGLRGAFIIARRQYTVLLLVLVLAGDQHSGIVLDCSKSSRQCSLPSFLTYLLIESLALRRRLAIEQVAIGFAIGSIVGAATAP